MTTGTATLEQLSPEESAKPTSSKRLKRNDEKEEDRINIVEEKKETSSGVSSTQKYSAIKEYKSVKEQVATIQQEVSTEPYRNKAQIRPLTSTFFDPIQDAPHNQGQPMPFWFVANTMSIIETTTGKNSQTLIKEIISNMFRTAIAVNPSELGNLFYFFIIKLAPEFVGLETGVGHEMVVKAVAKSCGKSVQ